MSTANDKDSLVGRRIREYEILEQIGKGGMGAVYRARHVYLDEERAVKVIDSRLASERDFIDRFIREAKILTRLRHPNLVQLFEFGTLEQDLFFMVLEFLRGESVLQRLRRKSRIPLQESIGIIRQAALGLHSAHEKGIVHRDISPDNLFLIKDETGEEVTKVIDFGIAKPNLEFGSSLTATSLYIGKPEYSSPEQCGLLEEGEIIDRRSDIYSLGVTMYYMLAGQLPFHGTTPQALLVKHVTQQPQSLTSHFPPKELPELVNQIVMKTLAKRREDRYATMEELIRDLNQALPDSSGLTIESSSVRPLTELKPGDQFARRYVVEKKLGEGGMGAVFKAVDKILEIPVALKIMSTRVADNERTLERFKREVILARKVAHPNACRIYDIGESRGTHYVSMEYLEGETLSEMLNSEGALKPELGLSIMRQVLLALQEAHRVGVVHRDLKLQNIMVDPNMRASIMDFGISISADTSRVTQTGMMVGSPHYMAPEQFEGRNIDQRTDIYSVGVIMYQIFTGRLPFEGESAMSIIFAHLKSEPPKPSDIIPGFPPELEKIILKAMEKEPGSRYQNVLELLRDVEKFQGDPSNTINFPRESVAHKLIAEKNYSKAIKYIKGLLQTDPANQEWKKLLEHARSEKTRKDLKRAKSLIRKNNFLQAQQLIEKINKTRPAGGRMETQIRKIELLLDQGREQAVGTYLQQAETFIVQKDFSGAVRQLEAASHLKPEDPRIRTLEQALTAQQIVQQPEGDVPEPQVWSPPAPPQAERERVVTAATQQRVVRPSGLPSRALLVGVIAGAVFLLLTGSWLAMRYLRKDPGRETKTETPPPVSVGVGGTEKPPGTTVAAQPVPVIVNALPWANVKIQSKASGVQLPEIPSEEAITPCVLMLPEGVYEVTFTNPSTTPLVKQIQVRAGGQNEFVFAMPDYDAARASTLAMKQQ